MNELIREECRHLIAQFAVISDGERWTGNNTEKAQRKVQQIDLFQCTLSMGTNPLSSLDKKDPSDSHARNFLQLSHATQARSPQRLSLQCLPVAHPRPAEG